MGSKVQVSNNTHNNDINQVNKLRIAKLLFFTTAMSSVGWNRFQNNFYIDLGLSTAEIGGLKSIGLCLKFIGEPLMCLIADLTDPKFIFAICMCMQIFSMELLRTIKPLSYNMILFIKILRTTTTPSITLTTTASFHLTKGTNEGYGKQRTFGSLAWGIGAFIAGFFIDKYGMNSLFYYTYFFNFFALFAVIFGLPNKKKSKIYNNKQLNSNGSNDSNNINNINIIDESNRLIGQDDNLIEEEKKFTFEELFLELKIFLKLEASRVILTNALIFGIIMTVPDTFLFISLEKDFNVSRTFSGLCISVSVLSCLPLFWYSDHFLNIYGHFKLMYISQISCILRLFLYSTCSIRYSSSKYFIMSIQLLHGFTFAFYWSAVVDAIYKLSSKESQSTCMSSLNILFYTIGGALGNVIFGNIYDYFGGVYFVYIISLIIGVINIIYLDRYEKVITSSLDIYKILSK